MSAQRDLHLTDPDGFYELLLAAHQGRTAAESEAFNARLVLCLANQVGDIDILKDCIAMAGLARQGLAR